jgi:CheY-like chemotaxis protein
MPIRHDEASVRPKENAKPTSAARQSRRVLVVDDNVDAAKSMALLLRFHGHQVSVAHSGPQALELAVEQHPEIVLLDIGLPGMDGYEVARAIRTQSFGRAMLLVALTGYGQEDDRRRTHDAGFDHHLTKPADIKVLSRLIEEFQPVG